MKFFKCSCLGCEGKPVFHYRQQGSEHDAIYCKEHADTICNKERLTPITELIAVGEEAERKNQVAEELKKECE